MRIQRLHIQGFRSLHDVEWEPGNLNVLIGANGSGKSNLLWALELLCQSARGHLHEEIKRSGGPRAIAWDGQSGNIFWQVTADCHAEFADESLRKIMYELLLSGADFFDFIRIVEENLSSQLSRTAVLTTRDTQFIARDFSNVSIVDDDFEKTNIEIDKKKIHETVLSTASAHFHNRVIWKFKSWLEGWQVYHDINFARTSEMRRSSVSQHTERLASDANNLVPFLHTLYSNDRQFKRILDDAMRAAFGTGYEELTFPSAADQRIQLRLRWRSLQKEQSSADLSDGTLRFLVLVAILANPSPGSVIAFDEPEAGLHPQMLPIIAELAVAASEKAQVIFTTHSPDFLEAFTDTIPTTTIAECREGKTHLSVLDGGSLKKWLEGYSLGAAYRSGELETQV